MITRKLLPLLAVALFAGAFAMPASADDSQMMSKPSAMNGAGMEKKPAPMTHHGKPGKTVAKGGAKSNTAGMSSAAMGAMSSGRMTAKTDDSAMTPSKP